MLKGAFGKLVSGGAQSAPLSSPNLATPYGRLMAFFAEIDNTAAQRRLTLIIGDAEMTFDVRNKRVLRMVELKPDSDGRGALAKTITRDFNHLDVQLKLLAELLTGFLARHGQFDIASRPSTAAYSAKADGFPVSEWRFACDLYGVLPAAVVPEVGRAAQSPKTDGGLPLDLGGVSYASTTAPLTLGHSAPGVTAPAEPQRIPEFADAAPQRLPGNDGAAPQLQPVMTQASGLMQPLVAPTVQESDTISSIIAALESDPVHQADVLAATAETNEARVEKFFHAVKKYCDLSMLLTADGDVLDLTESASGWTELAPEIGTDMKAWVEETSATLSGNQLVMMRSPILQDQSVIFMTSGSHTVFATFSSHVTGRIFQVTNDFFLKRI